ncbi:MAG: sugar transferase, partial [Acidobacteria bacterium]|nr:sugar transferase [Acidobacteriota bacterium]
TPVRGSDGDLLALAQQEGVTDIVVAIQGPISGEMFRALLDARENGIDIVQMPVLYEELFGRVPIRHLESDWILRSFLDQVRVSRAYVLIKRSVDIAGAVAGLIAAVIILPWACLAIVIDTGRPVFFVQYRMGQGGTHYNIVKLRTMHQDAEPEGEAVWAVEKDPRVTRVGRLLRATFIDELPQFWNVLFGSMSLVGPRP